MKYQLVLQWPASPHFDFDIVIEREDALIENMTPMHEVDGHDFGSGEMNIFILTDFPQLAFEEAKQILTTQAAFVGVKAAFRNLEENAYIIVWPPDLKEFKVT